MKNFPFKNFLKNRKSKIMKIRFVKSLLVLRLACLSVLMFAVSANAVYWDMNGSDPGAAGLLLQSASVPLRSVPAGGGRAAAVGPQCGGHGARDRCPAGGGR